MLELDVLLNNFLNETYLTLPVSEKKLFTELLTYPDPELFAWLIGRERPENKELARITEIIHSHARSGI
ncbi:MAG: succinate dehydrogenase assembly factor 2 [Gammaproteobacteria bacterium]|nr:succinate dehydrogenase assembly factor 2 [Gammaproteobacteria bacterium]MCW5583986.1 succinate dehydrogenase assembly factor 2 [Gammaproteobacteria bacterium]